MPVCRFHEEISFQCAGGKENADIQERDFGA